ncbi:tetrahydrofolate dehydrogenase/cyclohydrolase catalytic domain-containing protein [Patescibacteria group bacterium]
MIILDGKKLSEKILKKLKEEIKKSRFRPILAVILIGDNLVSKLYIKQKEKACVEIGAGFRLFCFPLKINIVLLKKEIEKIVDDSNNSGVIIQLPLPKELNTQEILDIVPPEKDVDVLSGRILEKFYSGDFSFLPPVVGAVSEFFKEYKISFINKKILLIGAGRLVGKPLASWFFQNGINLSVANKFSKNILSLVKNADIIISGAGNPGLIKGNMIKKGVIVIDIGTGIKNGRVLGDVDFKTVSKKAGYLTPVPGGIGPVTVACLLKNLVFLNKQT